MSRIISPHLHPWLREYELVGEINYITLTSITLVTTANTAQPFPRQWSWSPIVEISGIQGAFSRRPQRLY